ncbi:tryptophan-rich sensory protein [Candidatus Bathyarchaeota archaeon]|nr:tryptophan-rich sensory protein [Candidatus Bathyarchaeota archaeon]
MGSHLLRRRGAAMKLILSIILCQVVGVIGSIFTSSSISTWYPSLVKPAFTPPNWVFAPVWTILYLLMGLSLFLILIKGGEKGRLKPALSIFAVQLFLNGLWSYLFFGLRNPLYGLVGIILLWVTILITIVEASKISRLAAVLLIPYLAWVTIAATLNFYLWRLNV